MCIEATVEETKIGSYDIVYRRYEDMRLSSISILEGALLIIDIDYTEDIINYTFYTKASELCLIQLIEHITNDITNINEIYETLGQLYIKLDSSYTTINQYKELNKYSSIYDYVKKNAIEKAVERVNFIEECELDNYAERALEAGTEYVSCESETCDCIHISQLAEPDEVVGCQNPVAEYDTEAMTQYLYDKVKEPYKLYYIMQKINILIDDNKHYG